MERWQTDFYCPVCNDTRSEDQLIPVADLLVDLSREWSQPTQLHRLAAPLSRFRCRLCGAYVIQIAKDG